MLTKDQRDEAAIRSLLDPKRLALPPYPRVTEIRHQIDVDALGQDAARVYVILADEDSSWEDAKPIYDAIWTAFEQAAIDRRPYIQFRTRTEQELLDRGEYYADEGEENEAQAAASSVSH
jgi:hypothetical protein